MICVTLGYKDGMKKNPIEDANRGYCSNHKGFDYCGNKFTPVHF